MMSDEERWQGTVDAINQKLRELRDGKVDGRAITQNERRAWREAIEDMKAILKHQAPDYLKKIKLPKGKGLEPAIVVDRRKEGKLKGGLPTPKITDHRPKAKGK